MRNNSAIALAAAAIGAVDLTPAQSRVYGAGNIKRAIVHTRKASIHYGTSKYMPHQGEQECARRVRQRSALNAAS